MREKPELREIDESYVFCFQQRAGALLESIRQGFAQEGLGDLRGHIAAEDERGGDREGARDRFVEIRERFKEAASRTILPVFMVKEKGGWRPVNYEMDIAARIPWEEVNLDPVKSLTLSMYDEKDTEHVATLSEDAKEVVRQVAVIELKEGGIRVDPVFMTRQLCDIVPNPWQAHEFARAVLDHFRTAGDERVLANNFVFLIEELRKRLEQEKERLAEAVFRGMLDKDELRFLIIADTLDWTFPQQITVKPTAKTLTRKDGSQLQLSLLEFVPEDDFNETEKAVAWYLEYQSPAFLLVPQPGTPRLLNPGLAQVPHLSRLHFHGQGQGWHGRLRARLRCGDQGASYQRQRQDRLHPAGLRHLHKAGRSPATGANSGPQMKDKVLCFEVLAEDEWEAKLNEILRA